MGMSKPKKKPKKTARYQPLKTAPSICGKCGLIQVGPTVTEPNTCRAGMSAGQIDSDALLVEYGCDGKVLCSVRA